MKEKAIRKRLALSLVLVLVAAVFLVAVPMNVSADFSGTVFINADGTYTDGAPLSVSEDTYKLTDDINGNLVIKKSGIIVDGNGFSVYGGLKNGVIFYYVTGVTVMNVEVYGHSYGYGVWMYKSDQCALKSCDVYDNSRGIVVQYSDENQIKSNNVYSNNIQGIYLSGSHENEVKDNNVNNNRLGIRADDSDLNDIKSNTIHSNSYYGFFLLRANENKIMQNKVYENGRDGIRTWTSSDNMIKLNDVYENNYDGISLNFNSNGNSVKLNNVYKNGDGINFGDGIFIYNSDNNEVKLNTVRSNLLAGVHLTDTSTGNSIDLNSISGNSKAGVALWCVSSNTISNNEIWNNERGIFLIYNYISTPGPIDSNIITDNLVEENTLHGIYLDSGSNSNTVHHNDIIENGIQAYDDGSNSWDDGSEGNYWSDYTGSDGNNDGIGDTPYVIDLDSKDNYPLMNPTT
jgi:parallel beta-helix repeat protein